MVRGKPSASNAPLAGSSSTVRDGLWQRACRPVRGRAFDKANNKKDGGKERAKRKRRRKKKTTSDPTTDDFYLRWNPTGDYDSDDNDWWNEVMAMERKIEQKKTEKEKKTAAEAEAAALAKAKEKKADEGALYLRYKYHTKMVMKWGLTSWADRYGRLNKGTTPDGDGGDAKDGNNEISLRTMIGRLHRLATDGVSMPPNIYRNLEHAVELREEFQDTIVMERHKSLVDEKENQKRKKKKPPKKSSTSPEKNSSSNDDTGVGDNKDDADKTDLDDPKDSENENPDTGNSSSFTAKYHDHQWLLHRLRCLSKKFRTAQPKPKRPPPLNKGDNSLLVIETTPSLQLGKPNHTGGGSMDVRSPRIVTELQTSTTSSFDKDAGNGSSCNDSSCNDISCNANDCRENCYIESSFLHPGEHDDVVSQAESPTLLHSPPSSTLFPSPLGHDHRCVSPSSLLATSTSESTVQHWERIFQDNGSLISDQETADWDRIFDDDGSLISSPENSDQDIQLEDCQQIIADNVGFVSNHNHCDHDQETKETFDQISGDNSSLISNHESCKCDQQTEKSFDPTCGDRYNSLVGGHEDTDDDQQTEEDWDRIFDDDGSLISSHKSCGNNRHAQDCDPVSGDDDSIVSSHENCDHGQQTEDCDPICGGNSSLASTQENCDHDEESEVWDRMFGDDGSLISSNEQCDHCQQDLKLETKVLVFAHDVDKIDLSISDDEDGKNKALGLPQPTLLTLDNHEKLHKTNQHQEPDAAEVPMSPTIDANYNTKLMNNEPVLPNHLNNDVRKESPTRNHDKPLDKTKGVIPGTKNVFHEMVENKSRLQTTEAPTNRVMTVEEPSTPKSDAIPILRGASPERFVHSKHYGSVWEMAFEEDDEKSSRGNAVEKPIPPGGVSLQSSNPPDNWEMLHDDEEEDIRVEEQRSRTTREIEERELSSGDMLRKAKDISKIKPFPLEETKNEPNNPCSLVEEHLFDGFFGTKEKKPPYARIDNSKHDSIWDIFINEQTNESIQLTDIGATTRAASSTIVKTVQPQEDWEALYS